MRPIKFRGKSIETGEFVFGNLLYWAGDCQIWEIDNEGARHNYSCDPETVGQFTGLTDKHGVEIFEGDVLKTNEHIDSVVWRDDLCGFSYKNDSSRMNLSDWIEHGKYSGTEIIGNIYQNPEILTN